MEQTRADLKIKFDNGKRPSGADFGDLLDSFINPKDDNIRKDGNGNFVLTLGNAPDAPAAAAGTLRFSAGKVQFSTGAAWQDMGGGAGVGFQPVNGTVNIAYSAGNVGINTGANQPGARLEVGLAANEQVRMGNAAVGNSSLANAMQISQIGNVAPANFALRQEATGRVQLNAPANQKLTLSKGGNQPRLSVIETGSVVVGAETDISGTNAAMQVNGDLFINGNAIRPGGGTWQPPSDARLKKDIRPFTDGLARLMQINPVTFRYNGLAQLPDQQEYVGVLGQEMAKVLPYTISTASAQLRPNEAPTDVLVFDPNALFYVLINAVKELADKVQTLEKEISSR